MGKPCPDFCVLPFSAVLFKTVAASHTCYIYLFFLVSTSCSFKTLFWLCQVFIAASGLSVVAVEREFLSSACAPASDCGSFSDERSEFFPDLPTMKEQGLDISYSKFHLFAFPAGTPTEIVDTFSAALEKVCADETFQKELGEKLAFEVMYKDPADSVEFMKEIDWVQDLKVRFGYGVTGNNDFDASFMANLLGSDTNWMLPNGVWAYSYGKTQNVNANLGWEQKKEWDLGVDYSFFEGRLYGKFDYYRRKIDNLLYSVKVPQPPYTIGSQYQNIGSMESKGWEFEVGGDIIRTKDFTWTSNINMSHNTGKILTLWGNNTYYNGNGFVAPGSPGDAARMEEGSTIGSFYLWKFAGFDDDGNFLLYNKDGEVIPAADKSENDKQYMGNYTPKLILAWNNTLSYKNFDLGINMRSWIDFDVYNTINMYYGIQGRGNTNVLKDAYGKFSHIKGEKQICDYYLEDGTFLKIDAITLGYTLPMKKYTNNLIDRIRIYATVGNVCTITGYSGMNPEVKINGWDEGTEKFWDTEYFYPLTRTYTLGLQFNF